MLLSIKDQYIQQGYERGYGQGYKQGVEQGIEHCLTIRRKTLVTVLKNRFKKVPLLIQKKIELIHNDMFLQMLIVNAAVCKSMEEFCEKLS